ncbi:hypothetical protein PTSG_09951 [Salpingoeca rosetta]|uniref:PARP catalytic domain-containing protein n=1 Tax=Salpingoeca rosetta (strain ATCC 50818 / BSB-021) TaxID=946362 RepID=F2UNM5_SALR5|nr:uncharacterized protein PTSG_09951 [Salpingoeca rosetta]EGD79230.1 hypothetical protein PTSG_09951 [Salpingoeca rosetta]|eukprot:XP_004989315.1 hypothetical protein PTSG_09951 [Salpingoeca rosetta]
MPGPQKFKVQVENLAKSKAGDIIAFGVAVEPEDPHKFFFNKFWVGKHNLDSGKVVDVVALLDKKGWTVLDIPIQTKKGVKIQPWQRLGSLPDTEPGAEIQNISIACYGCNEILLSPDQIHKFNSGCIWSKGMPDTIKPYGRPWPNPAKDCSVQDVHCVHCGARSLGSYYEKPYDDQSDKQFPCVKLDFRRQPNKTRCPNYKSQVTVLHGDKAEVMRSIERLKRRARDVPSERVTQETYSEAATNRAEHSELKKQLADVSGPDDAPWKFPTRLLLSLEDSAIKAGNTQFAALDLDLPAHKEVVLKLLEEAGGPTANEAPLRPFRQTLAGVSIFWGDDPAFYSALKKRKTRYKGFLSTKGHKFAPKYTFHGQRPTDPKLDQVLQRVTMPGVHYNMLDSSLAKDDPPVRIQRVFHGVRSIDAAKSISTGGFARLQTTDSGWFGAGIYFTPDLDYALQYAGGASFHHGHFPSLRLSPHKRYHIVLACDIQYANPYPVLRRAGFEGKMLQAGHDAHVVVVGKGGSPLPDSQWSQQNAPVAEIVIDQMDQALVRAVLFFEA